MFSERLKAVRAKAGLSQKALAKMLFVSQQAVGKWEVDQGSPNPETIAKIAEIFDVSTDYLLGLTDLDLSIECVWNCDHLYEIIKQRGVTTADVAKSVGMSEQYLHDIAAGRVNPTAHDLVMLSEYFKVDVDYLLGRTWKKETPTPVSEDGLNAEQLELVSLFESAPPALRSAALAVLRSAEGQGKAQGGDSADE